MLVEVLNQECERTVERMAELPRDTLYHYESTDGMSVTVTMTKVVRCKDCKHNGTWSCMVNHGADEIMPMDNDDFCSWGDRKDEVKNGV